MAACLFREFQLGASFEGLVETVPGVNLELLRMDKYELDPGKDTLFRGEFEVVRELIAALPEAEVNFNGISYGTKNHLRGLVKGECRTDKVPFHSNNKRVTKPILTF